METYSVFVRNWWKRNPSYPDGLEPGTGRKKYLARSLESESAARDMARVYNLNHKPGKLSRKAEYESD